MDSKYGLVFDEAFSSFSPIRGIVFDLAFADAAIDESVFDEAFETAGNEGKTLLPAKNAAAKKTDAVFEIDPSVFDEAFEIATKLTCESKMTCIPKPNIDGAWQVFSSKSAAGLNDEESDREKRVTQSFGIGNDEPTADLILKTATSNDKVAKNTPLQVTQKNREKSPNESLDMFDNESASYQVTIAHPEKSNTLECRFDMEVEVVQTQDNTQSRAKRRKPNKTELIDYNVKYLRGTWVMCCLPNCLKWRYLKDIQDPEQVPEHWTCEMNEDTSHNSCEHPEDPENQGLQFVPGDFVVGAVKWVKLPKFPLWPAIIDDDPDSKTSIWLDSNSLVVDGMRKCHVTFFGSLNGSVTRSWVNIEQTEHFKGTETIAKFKKSGLDAETMENLRDSISEARKAVKMPLEQRRYEYCHLYKKDQKKQRRFRHHRK